MDTTSSLNSKRLEISIIKQSIISHDLLVLDNHLVYSNRLVNVQQFYSKGLYGILITLKSSKLTLQNYFNIKFANQNLNWKVDKVMLDSHMLAFQYKILSTILDLFLFRKLSTSLSSFCNPWKQLPSTFFLSVIISKLYRIS